MTKEEFFERFNLDELERICTNSEFLNVLIAEPFDLELAEDVADRVLSSNSPAFLKDGAISAAALPGLESLEHDHSCPIGFHSTSRLLWPN